MTRKYTILDIKLKMKYINHNIEIISDQYISPQSKLKCRCLIDNTIWEDNWNELRQNKGCPVCSEGARIILYDGNRLSVQRPDLIKYFTDDSIPNKISTGSNKKVDLKCPYCGLVKNMSVNTLSNKGFSCNFCSDKISIPEKFCVNILTELKTIFKPQYIPNWANGKRYDFYIPNLNVIIETHGRGHYDKSFSAMGGKSLEQEQLNDKLKYELAMQNGINPDNYIVIDCRHSEIEWLKNNHMLKLEKFFNLDILNWDKIWTNCFNSYVIDAINMWNKNILVKDISNSMNLSKSTIRSYLNRGNDIGLCVYDGSKNINKNRLKTVIQYDLNEVEINKFESCMDAFRNTGVSNYGISKCCTENNFKYTSGGYKWKYETNKTR